jgi:two-component system, LytTR family, response regulator
MRSDTNKIVIQTQEGSLFVDLNEIIFCRGVGSYTELTLTCDRKILAANLLKVFENLLVSPERKFIRIHRSFLINIDHIIAYRNCSTRKIILSGSVEIPVAYRKTKEFSNLMKKHFLHLS